jgi:hypothetical protein
LAGVAGASASNGDAVVMAADADVDAPTAAQIRFVTATTAAASSSLTGGGVPFRIES